MCSLLTKPLRKLKTAGSRWMATAAEETSPLQDLGDNLAQVDDSSANVLRSVKKQQKDGQKKGTRGKDHVLLANLKSCSTTGNLEWGKKLHMKVLESRREPSIRVATALVNMYAKCGSMQDAHQVFDRIQQPDVVSWTALLLGYVDAGEGIIALDLFLKMKSQGCEPDCRTYVAALKACACLAMKQGGGTEWLMRGKQMHSEIGVHLDLYVQNALVDMYAKCGSMLEAHHVFDSIHQPDVVSWTVLMLGYAERGEGLIALELFSKMKSLGCAPNSVTYVAALKACASLAVKQNDSGRQKCLERGRQVHLEIGSRLNLYVQNTLIDMYAKCGSMFEAREVFENIRHPDVVSWNALLLGYADSGKGLVTLDLFSRMRSQGYAPNSITYVAALKACGLLGALELGRKLHAEISEFDVILVTCLVDLYAKCGSMVEAQDVFDLHSKSRDVATWTALLAGYSNFGDIDSALGLFEGMQYAGFRPTRVTFQCLLMCCSHAGLIEKAKECLEAMPKYGVTPNVEHYTCVIDVLGRANKLDDVVVLLRRLPCNLDVVAWMTVLGACQKWKNVEIGSLAFQSLVSLDERNAAAYVLMADIYASRGMWQEREMVFGMRKRTEAWEVPGEITEVRGTILSQDALCEARYHKSTES